MEISIYGVNELNAHYDKIADAIKEPRRPFTDVKSWMEKDIDTNWRTEGSNYEPGGWRPLSEGTRKERVRMGYGGARPILIRTGRLKSGTVSKYNNSTLTFENKVDYFKYHQLGGSKIPRRRMLYITKNAELAVWSIFRKWISTLL